MLLHYFLKKKVKILIFFFGAYFTSFLPFFGKSCISGLFSVFYSLFFIYIRLLCLKMMQNQQFIFFLGSSQELKTCSIAVFLTQTFLMLNFGYFGILKLNGRLYRLQKRKYLVQPYTLVCVQLCHTNLTGIILPLGISVKIINVKRLILYSYDLTLLNFLLKSLIQLQPWNVYTGLGIKLFLEARVLKKSKKQLKKK